MGETEDTGSWTLLTAHGRALVEIVANLDIRMRDLADAIGVTERTAQAIVADLEQAGYVTHQRVGRRNHYSVNLQRTFRHRAQNGHKVGPFLRMLSTLPERGSLTEQQDEPGTNTHAAAGASEQRDALGSGIAPQHVPDTPEDRTTPQSAQRPPSRPAG